MFDARILIIGLVLWAVQYLLAGIFESLIPSGMRGQFPHESILPLVWHGGIWFDLPLTFWVAYLTKQHPEWNGIVWSIGLATGFVASWFMHFKVYAPATLPSLDPNAIVTQEAHVQEGKVTEVGWAHMVFFGITFAILINEAFFSKNPSLSELWATTAIVTVLLFVGNHMVLGSIKELFGIPIDYRGKPLQSLIGWTTSSVSEDLPL
jgi:hypothetical protein